MKLFRRFTTRSKVILSTVVAVAAVAAFALPGVTHAELGADRQTKVYSQGTTTGFDHVQFNSFKNVPNGIGDETQFFTGMYDGANTPFYDSLSGVQNGDTMLVRVYVHNNADSGLNASGVGVAKNTRVKVVLPTGTATNQTAQAFVSADNAQPQTIEDDFSVTGASAFNLQYVPGSATIKTNYQDVALSDNIISSGVLIGDKDLSGNLPGCFDHVALVTFKVKATTAPYSLLKQVRMNGTSTWGKQVTAKSGNKVDFALTFHNTSGAQENNVVLGDRLPVGLTYVPGTTMWDSGLTGNKWTAVTNDNWLSGGLNVGNYASGAAVYLKFTATVDDASKLQCGLNRITNFGFAKSGEHVTIQDSAEVDVTKDCGSATPAVFSCDLLDIDKNDSTKTVTIKTFNTTPAVGTSVNNVAFKTVDVNWGETGSTTLSTNTPVGQSHQYSGNGPYTITATAHFTVPGNDNATTASANCTKQVDFATAAPAAATTQLPNTGAGSVISIFATAAVAGALLHRLFLGRRFARR